MSDTTTGLVNKVAIGALIAGVLGWGGWISASVNTVTGLEPQIEAIQRTQAQHANWIAEWPRTGELAADVRQTEAIRNQAEELERLFEEIGAIQGRIRAIELDNARSNGQPELRHDP